MPAAGARTVVWGRVAALQAWAASRTRARGARGRVQQLPANCAPPHSRETSHRSLGVPLCPPSTRPPGWTARMAATRRPSPAACARRTAAAPATSHPSVRPQPGRTPLPRCCRRASECAAVCARVPSDRHARRRHAARAAASAPLSQRAPGSGWPAARSTQERFVRALHTNLPPLPARTRRGARPPCTAAPRCRPPHTSVPACAPPRPPPPAGRTTNTRTCIVRDALARGLRGAAAAADSSLATCFACTVQSTARWNSAAPPRAHGAPCANVTRANKM